FPTPLGSRLCILDFDSRPLSGPNELFSPLHHISYPAAAPDSLGLGILNHGLYALVHGYRHFFVRTGVREGRGPSWAKPGVIKDTTSGCEVVIFLDSDAIFRHLELPAEWLLNRWGVTRDTKLAMALDPGSLEGVEVGFNDVDGERMHNTGFIVAVRSERTREILEAWAGCVDGERDEGGDGSASASARAGKLGFPGCEKWAYNWPLDQGAWAEFVRRRFNESGDVRDLPCQEANGYEGSGTECDGLFVEHLWRAKWLLKERVGLGVVQ
ncbi:hypothetical protein K490DRAFT_8281, partial [Saccharata proteae CBS 121410]